MEIAVLITSCMRNSKVTWYQPQNMEAVKPFEISNTSTCTRCSKNGNQVPTMKLRPGNQDLIAVLCLVSRGPNRGRQAGQMPGQSIGEEAAITRTPC